MSDANSWVTVFAGTDWTTVLVALAAGLSAAAGPVFLHYLENRKERAGVRAALIAEVVALADVIRSRRYCEELQMAAQNLLLRARTATPFTEAQAEVFQVPVPDQYNLIYRENASRLGCLEPSEALDVVRFYQLVLAVNADISPGGALFEGTVDHRSFTENRALLIAALDLAERLAVKVGLRVDQKN